MPAASSPPRPPRWCSPPADRSRRGRAFYADVKGRAAKVGRNPDHIKILPGAFTIIGDSLDEAKEKRAQARQPGELRQRHRRAVDRGSASMRASSIPTGRCPRSPRPTRARAAASGSIALAKRENLTVRQLAGRLGGYGGLAMMGTPKMIADQMEEWLDDRRLATAST